MARRSRGAAVHGLTVRPDLATDQPPCSRQSISWDYQEILWGVNKVRTALPLWVWHKAKQTNKKQRSE